MCTTNVEIWSTEISLQLVATARLTAAVTRITATTAMTTVEVVMATSMATTIATMTATKILATTAMTMTMMIAGIKMMMTVNVMMETFSTRFTVILHEKHITAAEVAVIMMIMIVKMMTIGGETESTQATETAIPTASLVMPATIVNIMLPPNNTTVNGVADDCATININ